MHKVERAVIMAAGKGTRMYPLTENTPKPLIPVFDEPIIERTIKALKNKGINEIYIVVGYLAEKFNYLKDKYNVELINNPLFDTCNNISSLYAARDHIENSVILEGDIWIENDDLIKTEFDYSGYTSIPINEPTNEWLQTVDGSDFMISCSRTGGISGWILYGISYWSEEDAVKLAEDIETEFIKNKNTEIYWDDVAIFCYPEKYKLKIKRSNADYFREFDSIEDLSRYDKKYLVVKNEN